MKRILTLITLLTIFIPVSGQKSIVINLSNGIKWEKFNYVNQNGSYINQLQINYIYGLELGYETNYCNFEIGFFDYKTHDPVINFSYRYLLPENTGYNVRNTFFDSWLVPVKISKSFYFWNEKLSLQPSFALSAIIARNFQNTQPNFSWSFVDKTFPDTVFFTMVYDTTKAYSYRSSTINFGLEFGLSVNFKISNNIDISLIISTLNSFYPIFYDTIQHSSAFETYRATNTATGTSYSIKLGLRYKFNLLE